MGLARIAVVGNIGGGKTALSRRLAEVHGLPCTHVDSLQYLPDLSVRPLEETRARLRSVEAGERWLIDGYGPLDLLEARMRAADRVVFVDFPRWRHLWWLTKRQLSLLVRGRRRSELPEGANELGWRHTRKLYKTLLGMDRGMNPELRRILARPVYAGRVVHVRTPSEWRRVYRDGLSG
jgi:hypothetical protein